MTSQGIYQSSVVAQLAGMPVATLRVWERRYTLGCAELSPTGRRLYSREDVQRIILLKQLTERGHAIGALVRLDEAALRALGDWPAAEPAAASEPAAAAEAPTWWLVGSLPAAALELAAQAGLKLQARFDRLEEAMQLAADAPPPVPPPCALLLLAVPALNAADPLQLRALAARCGAQRLAVVYRFGASADLALWSSLGVALMQEPRDPAAWLAWMQDLLAMPAPPAPPPPTPRAARALGKPPVSPAELPPAQRRYAEPVLRRMAAMQSAVACECPQHVAEILLLLSQFEDYSARCLHRNPEDAELHADLQRAAAAARSIFEMALERVAAHEGVDLTEPAP